MSRLRLVLALSVLALTPAGAQAALPAGNVTFGAAFSLTGAGAIYGASQAKGAQLAIAQLNAAGTLAPATLVLNVNDDASDADQAATIFGDIGQAAIAQGGLLAFLGPTLSSAALSADQVAQDQRTPVLGVSNTADGIVEIGEFVFRDSIPESAVVPQTVKVAFAKEHVEHPAMIWAKPDTSSRNTANVFRATLKKRGVPLKIERAFQTGEKADLPFELGVIAKKHPDALIISALAPDAVKVMKAARKIKALAKVPFIGGNQFNSPGLLEQAGKASDGAISGAAWLPTLANPGNAAFVASYKAMYGAAPDQFAAQAYAGVQILTAGLAKAGVVDRDKLREALTGLTGAPTVLGTFGFDASRNPILTSVVVQARGGVFRALK